MAENQFLQNFWVPACANFDISIRPSIITLVTTLEEGAQLLTQGEEARVALGADASLWTDLRKLWRDLARAQLTFWDVDDDGDEDGSNKEKDLRTICGSLSKFTRNLVAGVPQNQIKAYENEPDIRRLLHYHTSWSSMEDDESVSVARVLTQALSNIVTTNEALTSKLWDTYMNLPEDQVVLIRLLTSPDPRTVLTVLIFILNCIHGSRMRTTMLTRTAVGTRVCISILDDMLKLYDAEEASVGAQAFDVGYEIVTQLVEQGLIHDLYDKFTMSGEIVTPHQTTLLKIVDSYLQSIQLSSSAPAAPKTIKIHRKISPMLAKCFLELSFYTRKAVGHALRLPDHSVANQPTSETKTQSDGRTDGDGPSAPKSTSPVVPAELDVMLPKVCEALVLVTQCIITIALEADQSSATDERQPTHHRDVTSEPDLKAFFNETQLPGSGVGIVESLIELLRLLDLFLPRINFGKPVSPTVLPKPVSQVQSSEEAPKGSAAEPSDPTGFQYLKRDLVRLLGILCHGVRAVQDHVRVCGGIPVVMNLCVIDERNPYLREHAIFTLHCLLKDNNDSQLVVDAIRPSVELAENKTPEDNGLVDS